MAAYGDLLLPPGPVPRRRHLEKSLGVAHELVHVPLSWQISQFKNPLDIVKDVFYTQNQLNGDLMKMLHCKHIID